MDYFFSQPGLFVLPIEALDAEGVQSEFAQQIVQRGLLSEAAVKRLNASYKTYWQRTDRLREQAPGFWFPPRAQHLCIVTDGLATRPYFQPFNRNSWLLYASDFEAASGSAELAIYTFLHAERLGLTQQILPALHLNLSYFLTLSDEQRQDFVAGCRRCKRPDAAGFRALGEAQAWIKRLHHVTLRPTRLAISGAQQIPDSGLIVERDSHRQLLSLQQSFGNNAQGLIQRYEKHQRSVQANSRTSRSNALRAWLSDSQPRLVITSGPALLASSGNPQSTPPGPAVDLWSPDQATDLRRIDPVLEQMSAAALESVHQDLQVVAARSQEFLDSLRHPEKLVDPAPHISEGGLSYIHRGHKLIAYALGGDNPQRLWEPAPPYERLMLGARTIHEWGHLAAESGWVGVPEDQAAAYQGIREQISELLQQLQDHAPPALRNATAGEVRDLSRRHGSLAEALLKRITIRAEDYQSNLLARCFLPAAEMDTYVRNNVCSQAHSYSREGIYMQLVRQVYEFQYLGLSTIDDPWAWLMKSTWMREQFIASGVISEADFRTLTQLVGELCGCYQVDQSQFDVQMMRHPPDSSDA